MGSDQTADRTRDVADAAEYRTLLGKYVDHCEPGGSIQLYENIARQIASLLARLAEEIETLRRRATMMEKSAGFATDDVARLDDENKQLRSALTAAQAENARLRVEAFNAGLKHVHETLPKPSLTGDDIIAMRDEQDAALSADMPAGGGELVAVQIKPLEWLEVTAPFSKEDPRREPTGDYEAVSPIGVYYIEHYLGGGCYRWRVTLHDGDDIAVKDDPQAAKAAAQSDYERRIRSALITPPAPAPAVPSWLIDALNRHPLGTNYAIQHDGFQGPVIGYYLTLEGKPGVVMQLTDARVVHVYGEKWLVSPSSQENP